MRKTLRANCFWQATKPIFSNKISSYKKTTFCVLILKTLAVSVLVLAKTTVFNQCVKKKFKFENLLTNLSKLFSCIPLELFAACLWSRISALKLTNDYLKTCKMRTKPCANYNFCQDILSGVPHGFILRAVLRNIFMCNLFISVQGKYFSGNLFYKTKEQVSKCSYFVLY